jgi:AraC-like DNA-binding protein
MDEHRKIIYKNKMLTLDTIRLAVRHCRCREDAPATVWGPRTIPDYELLLIRQGTYCYSDSAGDTFLKKGDMLLIEPAIEHTFRKEEPQAGSHYSAHFDLIDPDGAVCFLNQTDSPERRLATSVPANIHHGFEMAANRFASQGKFRSESVNSAIRLIWLLFAENWFTPPGVDVPERLAQMMDYLRRNLAHHVTRLDLAREFHCSPEHVNYLFKKELGETPSRFINRERVLQAFKLMGTDGLNVQEAALQTGFSNQYYFSRVFRNFFGYPPSHVKMYRSDEIDSIYAKHLKVGGTGKA